MALIDTRYKFIKLDLDQQTQNIDMIFSLSDVETSDFYLQFTKNFLEINLTDYKLTLLICKPSKVVKSIVLDYDADLKAYYVNLTSELKNIEGKYWGQALIEDTATGEKRLTKSKFSYSVIKDILSEASENITEDVASDLIARVVALETGSSGSAVIDDSVISQNKVWSSQKVSQQMQQIVEQLNGMSAGMDLSALTLSTQVVTGGTKLILSDGATTKETIIPAVNITQEDINTVITSLNTNGQLNLSNFKGSPNEIVHFKVKINTYNANNDDNTLDIQDGENLLLDDGILFLPSNYKANGKPIRLIINCHGAGTTITDSTSALTNPVPNLVKLGYAVMDMNGIPKSLSNNTGLHYGYPAVLQSYLKGYDYVTKNYNLKKEVFVIGTSMGGLTANMLVQNTNIPVIAQALFCGVTDLFKQAWCNPWQSGQRQQIANLFNFNIENVNFTATGYPNASEIQCFKDNINKVLGFNPIMNGCINWDSENYNYYSDENEVAKYNNIIKLHKAPVKVWHNQDDQTVLCRYSEYFVNAIKKAGCIASFRKFPSGGHNAWDNGQTIELEDIDGNNITVKASTYELYEYLLRFDNEPEKQEINVGIINVTGITLQNEATVNLNETLNLIPMITPSNASNKNINWNSNDNTIASVSTTGVVTGLKEGNCIITATTEDGNFIAQCNVTVGYLNTPLVQGNHNLTNTDLTITGQVVDVITKNRIGAIGVAISLTKNIIEKTGNVDTSMNPSQAICSVQVGDVIKLQGKLLSSNISEVKLNIRSMNNTVIVENSTLALNTVNELVEVERTVTDENEIAYLYLYLQEVDSSKNARFEVKVFKNDIQII